MSARASAARYARALFDVALAEGTDLDAIGGDLSAFTALVAGHPQLQRVLVNPAIPAARKRALVADLFSRVTVTPVVSRVLLLLAERDRLILLPDLDAAYQSLLLDRRRVVRAAVTTAMPLPEDQVAALRSGLARATGRDVLLDVHVNPEIVGGAVARVGSTIYDGSVARQLEKLKQRLVDAEL